MLSRNTSGVPKSLTLLLSVGLAMMEKQLMASKLSSYLCGRNGTHIVISLILFVLA